MSLNTIDNYGAIDVWMYNGSGAIIKAHTPVMNDASPDGSATSTQKRTINPFDKNTAATEATHSPFSPADDLPLIGFGIVVGDATAADGDTPMLGVTQEIIPSGEWGRVRIWGPSLCVNGDTASELHLTAYGIDQTAGAITVVDPTAISQYVVGFQMGASGIDSALDLRNIFVTCIGLQSTTATMTIAAPGGILVDGT